MVLDDILKILKKKSVDKAYTINERSYTYEELYRFVGNINYFLLKNNLQKKPVVIYGHKDMYMKACFLACSFAGMTYVPVDESIPKERIELILDQVKPALIIGDYISLKYKCIPTKEIQEIMKKNYFKEIDNIQLKPNDTYYIIFTSGSTGVPKGVEITYKNLDSCIKWLQEIVQIQNGVILNQANFSFDLSVADLYLSLITQSEHYIIDCKSSFDFNNTFKNLERSNANMMVATPSYIDLLLLDKSFSKELMPNLNTILFCGEKLFSSTIKKLYERFDNLKIINSYGPTECTFAVTSIEVTKEMIKGKSIPVGIPKKDVEIHILNKEKNEVQDGESRRNFDCRRKCR